MLKRIIEWLALTNSERKVILFLVTTLSIGYGIQLLQTTFPNTAQAFDYKIQDSTFMELSLDKENDTTITDDEDKKGINKININTATKEQLMKLPGIGEITADRIIQYRKEKGKFSKIDELDRVKGINRKKIEKIKLMISIE